MSKLVISPTQFALRASGATLAASCTYHHRDGCRRLMVEVRPILVNVGSEASPPSTWTKPGYEPDDLAGNE
ncbi:hypothetical protein ASPCADRAFT_1182 [Aspergillus carbonarius ITEM 5010]|uniref:Uncharacterized protein n=1 Tax=Aspergillus carbonarius (strain ITEM 5010) TaxID=602072 RepID=A0A1R3RYD8_ASPC5|nr:hypothetical protein ASPCADRAFT_1182 [Aspergillus carbonarius ITEM 5010]